MDGRQSSLVPAQSDLPPEAVRASSGDARAWRSAWNKRTITVSEEA